MNEINLNNFDKDMNSGKYQPNYSSGSRGDEHTDQHFKKMTNHLFWLAGSDCWRLGTPGECLMMGAVECSGLNRGQLQKFVFKADCYISQLIFGSHKNLEIESSKITQVDGRGASSPGSPSDVIFLEIHCGPAIS